MLGFSINVTESRKLARKLIQSRNRKCERKRELTRKPTR